VCQGNGDKSSALLLATPRARSRSTVGLGATDIFTSRYPSQLSLATMPGARGNMPDLTSYNRWDSAFDFLTDGARTVNAFSRPYPTATIGVPTDVQFDIAKAEFRMVVRVCAEDAPVTLTAATTRHCTPSSHSTAYNPKPDPLRTRSFGPLYTLPQTSLLARC
jgi:hypothetical protein